MIQSGQYATMGIDREGNDRRAYSIVSSLMSVPRILHRACSRGSITRPKKSPNDITLSRRFARRFTLDLKAADTQQLSLATVTGVCAYGICRTFSGLKRRVAYGAGEHASLRHGSSTPRHSAIATRKLEKIAAAAPGHNVPTISRTWTTGGMANLAAVRRPSAKS